MTMAFTLNLRERRGDDGNARGCQQARQDLDILPPPRESGDHVERIGEDRSCRRHRRRRGGRCESGPLVIDGEHTRRGIVGQEPVIVTIEADIWRDYEVGGPYAECARAEVISSQRIHVALTLEELLAGVTLRSGDGTLEVTLQMTTWRRTLIG
jgi:hypothetical protein